jgi:hypothetical protein
MLFRTGAAERGRLSILQWLRTSVQCPWDAAAVGRTAAQNGDLPLLNWLSSEEANGRWKDGDGESCIKIHSFLYIMRSHVYRHMSILYTVFKLVLGATVTQCYKTVCLICKYILLL